MGFTMACQLHPSCTNLHPALHNIFNSAEAGMGLGQECGQQAGARGRVWGGGGTGILYGLGAKGLGVPSCL